MAHVLTLETLQPIAALTERSQDTNTRIAAVHSQLDEVRKSLDNLIDAIEQMGFTPHIQERYDKRNREEEKPLSKLASLEALAVKPDIINSSAMRC